MSFLKNKKILITCGPTWIPIDDMRVISNKSTGSLGQMMAQDLVKSGAKVTLLQGPVTNGVVGNAIQIRPFLFYDELLSLLKTELKKKYDIIIHAAAVSDYKVKNPSKTKLSSHMNKLTLELIPTQKIIPLIKKFNPNVFLIGFKLESQMTKTLALEKTKDLFKKAKCDLVVANSFHNKKYTSFILNPSGTFLAQAASRKGITNALLKVLNTKNPIA
ncbi:Phosphopantothenoylcysteine decarboxylase / Phosphopantothenoylcysteine synthetase [hydrothermal vent metagenome]|uniref:Phosphopantothenoylcysteine decarboxylase / Phosphopantothenoylcysteine synthetase n=1 Tax=hydrothermal vent metagenome TaxID=652676 RepID=A0A3B1DI73_9ZZZZ